MAVATYRLADFIKDSGGPTCPVCQSRDIRIQTSINGLEAMAIVSCPSGHETVEKWRLGSTPSVEVVRLLGCGG